MTENKLQNKSEERRKGDDRRNFRIDFGFPFIDSHGHLVTEDRRKAERRESLRSQTPHKQTQLNQQTA